MTASILTARTGDIVTVTLSNPTKFNALNAAMWRQLRDTFRTLAEDAGRSLRLLDSGHRT